MATQDTTKFGDIALLFGDGATPTEAFEGICGITSYNWTTSTNETTEDLPDCEDDDKPGYISPTVTAVGDTMQIQGYVDKEQSAVFGEWIRKGLTKNIRIVDTKEGIRTTGPAVVTNRERSWERRQSGRFNITIRFTAEPTETPIVP